MILTAVKVLNNPMQGGAKNNKSYASQPKLDALKSMSDIDFNHGHQKRLHARLSLCC